jgi:dTDP-4-amino-4,6-dideoxygalactose transaminase
MARIPCVDLAGEYAEIGPALEEAVLRVLRSGAYVLGPELEAFERELAERVGVRFAVGVASGTDALVLALRAVGVGPGSEVVTSPFSYFATVEAIRIAGARAVYADIESDGFNLDPESAERAVGARTSALLPVHLFGRCAAMPPLCALGDAAGVPVVEDAAQSIDARRAGRAAGAFGAAACFSFYPSKNLAAAGDAGAVTTDDPEVADALRLLGNHGARQRDHHEQIGTNSRLDTLQAAVLRAKLPYLEAWTRARSEVARGYAERLADLPGLELPEAGEDERVVWNQYAVRCRPEPLRAAVVKELDAAEIEWRHFYPQPIYRQPALGSERLPEGSCPEAERACREVLCLPIHPRLSSADLDRVAEAVRRGAGR